MAEPEDLVAYVLVKVSMPVNGYTMDAGTNPSSVTIDIGGRTTEVIHVAREAGDVLWANDGYIPEYQPTPVYRRPPWGGIMDETDKKFSEMINKERGSAVKRGLGALFGLVGLALFVLYGITGLILWIIHFFSNL